MYEEYYHESTSEEDTVQVDRLKQHEGTSGSQPIVEAKAHQHKQDFARQERKMEEAKQRRKKLLDSIGTDAYNGVNLFEGTTPAPAQKQQGQGALDGVAPSDPGVDISSIFSGHSSKIWQKLSGKD